MEFSIACSLEGHSEQYNVPFPHLSSAPAVDQVNPGIGQIVNLFETIVPMRGQAIHAIEKKIEESKNIELAQNFANNDELKVKIGSGQSNLYTNVLRSFQNPIITDSIEFPKVEKTKKHKLEESTTVGESSKVPSKKSKLMRDHKFNVV